MFLAACLIAGFGAADDLMRDQTLAAMQEVMGPMPAADRAGPLDVKVDREEQADDHRRLLISYASEPGDRVPAWLLLPKEIEGRRPAVLTLHQTIAIGKDEPAGLGGSPGLHYGRELVARGYVVLAPDYPRFGGHDVDPYQLGYQSASMKAIWDNRRAVDLLAQRPEVDPERIGAIGHSLGGHNALFTAAFEPRIKAVVTSCGFTSWARYMNGDLAGWSHRGYMPRIRTEYGLDPKRMPWDFPDVLRAIAPRGVFVSAPTRDDNFDVRGVRECVESSRPAFAPDRLRLETPDAGHEFPAAQRQAAYRFLDEQLKADLKP